MILCTCLFCQSSPCRFASTPALAQSQARRIERLVAERAALLDDVHAAVNGRTLPSLGKLASASASASAMHTMGSAHSASELVHDDMYGGVSVDASSSSAQLALAHAHIGELVVFARSTIGTHAASVASQRTALRSVLDRTAAAVAQLDAAFADAASAATAAAAAHAPSGSSTRVSLAASLTLILSATGSVGGSLPSAEAALLASPYLQSASPPSRRPCAAVHRHQHHQNDASESALSSPPLHSQRPTERSLSASKAHRNHGHGNTSPPASNHPSRSVSNSAVSPPSSALTAATAYASPTRFRHAIGGSPDARSPATSAAAAAAGTATGHAHTTGARTATGTGTTTSTGRAAVHQARCIAEARAAVAAAHAALTAVANTHERQAAAVDGAQREFRQLETRVQPSIVSASASASASSYALFGSAASPSFSSSSASSLTAAPALPVSSTASSSSSASFSASSTAPASISASAHLLTARATLLQHQRRYRQSQAARQLGAILVARAAAARSHALASAVHQWTSFASHRRRQLEAFQVRTGSCRK